jgi:hypothetical protein
MELSTLKSVPDSGLGVKKLPLNPQFHPDFMGLSRFRDEFKASVRSHPRVPKWNF